MIEVIKFTPADIAIITGDRTRASIANHNCVAGPGYTVLVDGKPIACGGIRVHGCGVAWFAFSKEAEKEHLKTIIREAKKKLEEMQRENELCEVFAVSEDTDTWLKHLGFKKKDIFVR